MREKEEKDYNDPHEVFGIRWLRNGGFGNSCNPERDDVQVGVVDDET